jgi:hypothetical protein
MMVVSGCGSSAVSIPPPRPTSTPVLGVAMPGPQAQFVHDLEICATVDPNGRCPAGSTTQCAIQSTLHANWTVDGVPVGEKHTITCVLLVNDSPVLMRNLPAQGGAPTNFSISLAGAGELKLYWDAPARDSSTPPSDSFLAQSIAFLIQ